MNMVKMLLCVFLSVPSVFISSYAKNISLPSIFEYNCKGETNKEIAVSMIWNDVRYIKENESYRTELDHVALYVDNYEVPLTNIKNDKDNVGILDGIYRFRMTEYEYHIKLNYENGQLKLNNTNCTLLKRYNKEFNLDSIKNNAEFMERAIAEAKKNTRNTDVGNAPSDFISSKYIAPKSVVGKVSSGAYGADENSYLTMMTAAIKSKIPDQIFDKYKGNSCALKLKLAPDGMLLHVGVVAGDREICQRISSVAQKANMPRPPSNKIYEKFKNRTLEINI